MVELSNKALEGAEWKLRKSMAICDKVKKGKDGKNWKEALSGNSFATIVTAAKKAELLTSAFAAELKQALSGLTKDWLEGLGSTNGP